MVVQVERLSNGLCVVSDNMPHLETASIGCWVNAGARYESIEDNGISHVLEHMAFKGTELRTSRAIAEEVEAVGGYLNAYTSAEHTAYFARVLRSDIPLAVDLLADILQFSTFNEDELARERQVILQEIAQTRDTPDDIIFDHFQSTAYPDQALGRSILGTVDNVRGFCSGQLRSYMEKYYHGDRMVLCGAGAVDHDVFVRLVADAFHQNSSCVDETPEPALYHGGAYRENRELEQLHLLIGFEGVGYHDPDYYAAQVYSTILGGGMSSRLFQEVREKRGLAYSVHTFGNSYTDSGVFGIYAATGPNEVSALVPIVCEEICKLSDLVREEEVLRAHNQLKAGLMMSLESSMSRCEQLGRQLLIYGRILDTDELLKNIESVDCTSVTRIGNKITSTSPILAALGPIERLETYDQVQERLHVEL